MASNSAKPPRLEWETRGDERVLLEFSQDGETIRFETDATGVEILRIALERAAEATRTDAW